MIAAVATFLMFTVTGPAGSTHHVSAATTTSGVVVNVEDGDTFTVHYSSGVEERIRVAGINTNETNRKPSCYAREATQRLTQLVMGKTVELKARSATSMAEGRPIRHVRVNGTNVATQMLLEGFGVPLIFMEEPDHALEYLRSYWRAEAAGVGIHDEDRCGTGYAVPDLDMVVSSDANGNDYENVNGEWVLLRNRGNAPLDLTGWQLHDTALEFYAFPKGTVIATNGWLRVHVGVGIDSANVRYMGRTYPVFSGADGAFLLDPMGNIRRSSLWPCIGLCSNEPVHDVEISQVQYDVPGTDAPNDESLRLTNRGSDPVDLLDWSVHSYPYNVHVSRSTRLSPGASVTVYIGRGTDSASAVYMQNTASILGAEGDLVLLANPAGDVASCVAWGTSSCSRHPAKGAHADVGADFDGDGWGDELVGVPGEGIGGSSGAGAVNVEYSDGATIESVGGNNWQITGAWSETISQAGAVAGAAETGDGFGSASGVGDFDGDGYDDAVIGVPGEDLAGRAEAGLVNVLYGSRFGLAMARNRDWSQDGAVVGTPEAGDRFGAAIAVGDFDRDGFDDVVVGAPGEDGGTGLIHVLSGSAEGLTDAGNQAFSQAGAIAGWPERGDAFGAALVAADVDRDGYADLAVGAPGEDGGAGVVNVLFGGPDGLGTSRNVLLGQWGDIPGTSERGDAFGTALAAGDVDGDGAADLAIGAPGESLGGSGEAGAAYVVFGGQDGLDLARTRLLVQSNPIGGSPETGDRLGAALSIADLDADGHGDLAIGVPGEALGSTASTGVVHVVLGAEQGLSGVVTTVSQSTDGVAGASERGDLFGASLESVDRDGDGRAELAVGLPGEDIGSAVDAGSVVVVRFSSSGTTVAGSTGWSQWGARAGAGEAGDRYGAALGRPG